MCDRRNARGGAKRGDRQAERRFAGCAGGDGWNRGAWSGAASVSERRARSRCESVVVAVVAADLRGGADSPVWTNWAERGAGRGGVFLQREEQEGVRRAGATVRGRAHQASQPWRWEEGVTRRDQGGAEERGSEEPAPHEERSEEDGSLLGGVGESVEALQAVRRLLQTVENNDGSHISCDSCPQ